MERKAMIEFENFSFQYFSQAKPTLHDINLKIYEGEKVLIVGPSGSGKSTLGHCLNGLIPFSYKGDITGSLKIEGRDTKEMTIFDRSKSVGTVLQDSDGQFVGLTVGEDIAFALENDCMETSEMKKIVSVVSRMVEMGDLLKASPYELSGGQKQRVTFAGVMVNEADIFLFDEPLSNLDPATGKTAIDMIDKIYKEYQKTVIIIEHRLEDVLYRSVDRILVIDDGRIIADKSPDELVSSNILKEVGIREPLYATAVKYAGVGLTEELHPGSLEALSMDAVMQPLKNWYEVLPARKEPEHKKDILSIRNISFRYTKKKQILKNISFSIKEGEMVSIVGKNGAGKSTLAKLICGFVSEEAGEILYEGKSLKGQTIKERSRIIGYVMQNPNQMICKPMIYDEIALGLRIRGEPEERVEEKVTQMMKICGLSPFKKWPISALSYGQKKRVTIASMLVLDPKVLILDEPTAGQDYRHYTDIMNFLEEINKEGVTIILITHDMHLMLEYTPHAIVLCDGEKIGDASAAEILTDEDITKAANLKVTSLYELAVKAGIDNPSMFVQKFIDFETGGRQN